MVAPVACAVAVAVSVIVPPVATSVVEGESVMRGRFAPATAFTWTLTVPDVVDAPRLSYAIALIACAPTTDDEKLYE